MPRGTTPVLTPDLLTLEGSTLDKGNFATVPAEFVQGLPAEIGGDLLTGAITDFDAEIHGQGEQLLLVPDLITAHVAFTDGHQEFRNGTSVVGVGRRTGGDHPDKIAGGDGLGGGSADAAALAFLFRGFGRFSLGQRYAAWTHRADFAATSHFADRTGFHCRRAVKRQANPIARRFLDHLQCSRIDALHVFFCLHHIVLPKPDRYVSSLSPKSSPGSA